MKTLTVKTFDFAELEDDAQEVAIQNKRSEEYFDGWAKERSDSRKAAKEIYDQLRDIEGEISGARLYTYIINNFSDQWMDQNGLCKDDHGKIINDYWHFKRAKGAIKRSRIFVTNNLENCPFTGVCYDMDFMQPIIDFLKKPCKHTTNIDLADELPDYETIAERDYESDMSDEVIRENLENSDDQYFVNGHRSNL